MTTKLIVALRKISAVGLLMAVIGAAYFLIIAPITGRIAELQTSITDHRETLGRFLTIAKSRTETQQTEDPAASANVMAAYLQGDSDAVKTANLQAFIKEVAGAEGAKFRSSRALPPKQQGPVRLLGVAAEFSADTKELQLILAAIENAKPYLFIEALQISSRTPAATSDPAQKPLDVRFEVFGAVATKSGT